MSADRCRVTDPHGASVDVRSHAHSSRADSLCLTWLRQACCIRVCHSLWYDNALLSSATRKLWFRCAAHMLASACACTILGETTIHCILSSCGRAVYRWRQHACVACSKMHHTGSRARQPRHVELAGAAGLQAPDAGRLTRRRFSCGLITCWCSKHDACCFHTCEDARFQQ